MHYIAGKSRTKSIFAFVSICVTCFAISSAVQAMEIDLNDKDKLVSSLPINNIQISGGTNFDYSNPKGTLVSGDVVITSPQMPGLLKILFVDPSLVPTDQERQDMGNSILSKLNSI